MLGGAEERKELRSAVKTPPKRNSQFQPPAQPEAHRPASPVLAAPWGDQIVPEQWAVYRRAMDALQGAGLRFLLGGAFGLASYTRHWRNTKDIDFYIVPADRSQAVEALSKAGFVDYFDQLPYDRGWIYRATAEGLIVDLIWGTPNRRTLVDAVWFERSRRVTLQESVLEVVPAEELLWIKLYVFQRDRCDWPDLINLLDSTSAVLDWDRVIRRLDGDLPLLEALLMVFAWLCPGKAADIPSRLLRLPEGGIVRLDSAGPRPDRINLLDSRPWFTGALSGEKR
jgi:hypothetical protein